MKTQSCFVVFTDLDGTLLDHETYSFAPAAQALELLRKTRIPLILCSSKTRAELEGLQRDLNLEHPFISENGGGLFIPKGYFPFAIPEARPAAGYLVIEFGVPYFHLVETLHRVAAEQRVEVVGFSDLTVEEVAADCKLPLSQARLAKLREYDEPFRILDPDPAVRNRLFRALHNAGLRITTGGRYHHLTGTDDKGQAIRKLASLYRKAWGGVCTIGLGDSLNDVSLLREVDVPVLVPNPAAGATSRLLRKVPTAFVAPHPGPRGWNQAVLESLGQSAAPVC
jgi:mannosyl-3-phosphoglycerate phosphatase